MTALDPALVTVRADHLEFALGAMREVQHLSAWPEAYEALRAALVARSARNDPRSAPGLHHEYLAEHEKGWAVLCVECSNNAEEYVRCESVAARWPEYVVARSAPRPMPKEFRVKYEDDDKGFSEETCLRCGWRMGSPPLNCQNDNTPHRFPSSAPPVDEPENAPGDGGDGGGLRPWGIAAMTPVHEEQRIEALARRLFDQTGGPFGVPYDQQPQSIRDRCVALAAAALTWMRGAS